MASTFIKALCACAAVVSMLATNPRAAWAEGGRRAAATLAAADTIRGSVRDSAGGPVASATIVVAEIGRSTIADSNGAFALGDISPGRYTLVTRRVGYGTVATPLVVPASAPVVIELRVSALRLAPVTVTAARAPSEVKNSPLPVSELGAEKLRRDESVSIAHALDGLAGVREITTGQQIGTPVIRGLWGPRVLVLDGGLRLEDYSWSTEDGPSVDTRLAERVEVIRGPASVLYGSNAIGGVVNVITPTVPDAIGRAAYVHAGGELYGATNNSEFGGVVRLEGASGGFGWLATGIGRKAENFHTATGNDSTPTGEIYDTGYNSLNGELAVGLRGESSSGTLEYRHFGGDFGLVDGPPVPEDNTSGPLRRTNDNRVQATGNFLLGGSRLEAKAQWQSHSLKELEGLSRTGAEQPPIDLLLSTTTADVLWHHARGDWLTGTLGVSGMYQTNETMGVEPIVPGATTTNTAVFAFEQATRGKWTALVGLRGDVGKLDAQANTELALPAQTRNASAVTGDIGGVYRPMPALAFGLNFGRAFRAPTLIELFANGPFPAEGQYWIGLNSAVPEVSLNLDASVRWETPTLRAELAVYRNQVDNYLFLSPADTLSTVDQLAVYTFTQIQHATLTGLDFSAEWAAMPVLTLRGRFDMVQGTNNANDEPIYLMPPPRGDLEVELHTAGAKKAYVSVGAHVFATQTRLNPLDVPTSGYTLWEMGAGLSRVLGGRMMSFDVRVTNLFDAAYTDFLSRYKVFAYGPGRNVIFRLSVPVE